MDAWRLKMMRLQINVRVCAVRTCKIFANTMWESFGCRLCFHIVFMRIAIGTRSCRHIYWANVNSLFFLWQCATKTHTLCLRYDHSLHVTDDIDFCFQLTRCNYFFVVDSQLFFFFLLVSHFDFTRFILYTFWKKKIA